MSPQAGDGDRMRHAFVGVLLEHLRQDSYPSVTMMGLVERHADRGQAKEYVEILLDKLERVRYPSADLLNRVGRLLP